MIGDKLIVWLSFNVHGNEFAGTESAMTVAYELVNPSNAETKKWLENTIVILDRASIPMDIPDTEIGYEKFQGRKRIQTCQIENTWKSGLGGQSTTIFSI
jgi:hypothetical protein